ncbi:MAG: iron-containing alcohol dehydrogenase [Gemmataceae bacterium]|nr:iron-containing alcohol dehydrogenase [Gemmataceae bacterium]
MNAVALSSYDFISPHQVRFGWGRRAEVGELAASLGRRAMLVVGSRALERQGTIDELTTYLQKAGLETRVLARIDHEPEVRDVDAAAAKWAEMGGVQAGDLAVGIGGGSAIDLAKAAAAIAAHRDQGSVIDFLEGVGKGKTLTRPIPPILAIPTTAGTGTEATKNAVISSYDPPFKKSLRHERMTPSAVLIDPELTVGLPPAVTAQSGMDAITQLLESYLSRRAKPIPQALCIQGLELALPALPRAFADGADRSPREAMAHAAFLSGLALANSGLGLAHGVAAALGVHALAPHGLACAVMLPVALRVNRSVRQRELADLARRLLPRTFDSDEHAIDAFLDHLRTLNDMLGIPRKLSALGVRREQIFELAESSRGNSMAGNPRDVSEDELAELLEEML